MRGVLRKKGGFAGKEWQSRYFVPSPQDGQVLEYFITEAHIHPQGSFSLAGATVSSVDVKGTDVIQVCFVSSLP